MATPIFERETWLDITVNIIPLGIIGFFLALFTVLSPWGLDGLASTISYGLLIVPFVLLAYLTYLAGSVLEAAEA